MRCRWSEFSPAESCAFEVVAGQFLCERHLRFALQRAREAGPKPKSSLIARYRDKYIERLLIVAATLTVERLEEIVEHLGAIAFSGTEDGDVVIETPDGQQVKLPPLPADTGAPGGRDEARGLDELYHRVVRSVVSLDGDEDRLAREWSRIPDHVKRMMAEITGTRVRVQFLTGMPGMPHDFEEALNRLTDEEIDGLLHHWGIPGMRTGAAVDQRLRDEQILRPENLGAPALTQHGDHVAQIARLRRNLPLPDRFVTASELERRNKRGS